MATSPNFNWPEPDNTDLVKNGALAIRTAVNAIDTSLVDLKGGTTGQVLTKATNTDMDFAWANDATGGMTLLSTTSLTGGSVLISSISQAYTDLVGIVIGAYATDTGSGTYIRPNNISTAANYSWSGVRNIGSTVTGQWFVGIVGTFQISPRSTTSNTANQKTYIKFEIPRYSIAESHLLLNRVFTTDGTNQVCINNTGVLTDATAISSLAVISDYTFSGGTLYLYGVK